MTARRLVLEDPHAALEWLRAARARGGGSFDDVEVAHVFAVAAAAALARAHGGEPAVDLRGGVGATGAARFANAIGFDEVVRGRADKEPTEKNRTVSLTRVRGRGPKEAISEKIVRLLLPPTPDNQDARDVFRYVLVELLRNVVQHSQDPAGGIVAAQVNDAGPYQGSPALQVVVVDNGIGVFAALRRMRPTIATPGEALARALEPHVSGAFAEGESGTSENAGLGLFFVAEMAKLTAGRLFLASRGATFFLDRSKDADSKPVLTNGAAADYPGTLVVFEAGVEHIYDYPTIMQSIRAIAAERTPQRITQRWLRFEEPPAGVQRLLVSVASEDTGAAQEFARTTLQPRVLKREAIALDFRNLRVSTQSFVHALLHETVRLAWAVKSPIYVVNANPAVQAQLELVEAYSLGG